MTPHAVAVVLRDVGQQDVAALAALEREVFGAEAWSATVVAQALASRTRSFVVAEVDGELVGYAVLGVAGEVADLERIAVVAARRRTGLAAALLDAVQARAVRSGAERLLLEVSDANEGARAFYEAHGSVELDRRRRYYRDGSDALVLQLPPARSVVPGEVHGG